jgi:phosphoglycolate phosphatase
VFKLIIFDFDGTIGDTGQVSLEVYEEISKRHGFQVLSPEEIEVYRSLPIKTRMKKMDIPLRRIPKLTKQSWRLLAEKIPHARPFEGIESLLEAIQEKEIPMIILSSNATANIQAFLKNNQFHYFDKVLGGAKLFGKEKTLKKLIKRYQLDMKDVLYIGDELRDIDSCQSLGLPIAAVTWGFDKRSLLKSAEPDYLVDTPFELKKIIGL